MNIQLKREVLSHIILEVYQTPILMDILMIIMIITTITITLVLTMQPLTMVMELGSVALSHTSLEHITIMDFTIILIIMTTMTIITTMTTIIMTLVHTMLPNLITAKKGLSFVNIM